MSIVELQQQLKTTIFSHDALSVILSKQVSNVNAKISYMVKQGSLIRLRKGLYTFGYAYQTSSIDIISLANLLYAPSYLSFEYALSYYGLIPERVYEVTSASLYTKKVFETPIGRFSYRPIPLEVYALGVDWLYDEVNGGKLIATPEKALCDKIRADRGIGRLTQEKMADYLEFDLRIEWESLFGLDLALIEAISKAYSSHNLKTLSGLLKKRKKNA